MMATVGKDHQEMEVKAIGELLRNRKRISRIKKTNQLIFKGLGRNTRPKSVGIGN